LKITDAAATTVVTTIDDNTFKTVTGVEQIEFNGVIAGAFNWVLGGYANTFATNSSGVIKATATAFAMGSNPADDIVVNASGLGATNAINLTLTNTAAGVNDNDVTITGSAGNDTFTISEATAAADGEFSISGGAGNDTITLTKAAVAASTIELKGEAGNDSIVGSAGVDAITGGAGVDTMTGGTEIDTFIVTTVTDSNAATAGAIDWITDFAGASDILKVGANATELNAQVYTDKAYADMDIIAELNTLLNATSGTSTAKFDGTGADAAKLTTSDARILLAIDVNADGTFTAADVVVEITGQTGVLANTDIIV
jgi:Ca2+-binding RTX toxin-like protein